MAKSTRSKVKRHFRAKKRSEGVYAAAEAARINRLHQKLKALTTRDADGDVEIEEEAEQFNDDDDEERGWSWFVQLGLMDQDDITCESMQHVQRFLLSGPFERRTREGETDEDDEEAMLVLGLGSLHGHE